MNPENKLIELGLTLPPESKPAGNYSNAVVSGNLLYISGKTPLAGDKKIQGRLGSDYTAEEGYALARTACINLLASVKNAVQSLNNVVRVIDLHGSLCTTEDFQDHATVLDGASDLLVEVFGDKGLHTRSVIGVYSLRNGAPLTIKAILEVNPQNT